MLLSVGKRVGKRRCFQDEDEEEDEEDEDEDEDDDDEDDDDGDGDGKKQELRRRGHSLSKQNSSHAFNRRQLNRSARTWSRSVCFLKDFQRRFQGLQIPNEERYNNLLSICLLFEFYFI